MTAFEDRVDSLNQDRGHLCVGIDPRPDSFPEAYEGSDGLKEWCVDLVEATAPHAAAIKPNLGFFLQEGSSGLEALKATAEEGGKRGLLVILDGKFADIGSTAEAYATFAGSVVGADVVTLNPYVGTDVLAPFLEEGLDAFVLARTTNPSAAEIQDPVAGNVVQRFNRHGVGFVAPGNQPDTARLVRQTATGAPLLLPGVGAQGGTVQEAAAVAQGGPFLVTASRSIANAEGTFPEAAKQKARTYQEDLQEAVKRS